MRVFPLAFRWSYGLALRRLKSLFILRSVFGERMYGPYASLRRLFSNSRKPASLKSEIFNEVLSSSPNW